MNKLAIIVPAYNSGKYLNDLVYSIFGGNTSLGTLKTQSLIPDEIIIVDDASEDNTEEIIRNLQKKFDQIKYIRLDKNLGTSAACNLAISSTQCKFIARIDADDMREWFSLERLYEVLEKNEHFISYDDIVLFKNRVRHAKVWKMDEYDFDKLLHRNFIHSGIMFPRIAWKESGGYPEEFSDGRDDWAFNVALGITGYCGIHVNSAGYLYRREGQNRTLRNSSDEHKEKFKAKMQSRFSEIYSGRYPMTCCGGRNRKMGINSIKPEERVSMLIGSTGMTLIQYQGKNYGTETYFGPATGTPYSFSLKKSIRNVDNRDLHTVKKTGLLDLANHGKNIFSIYSQNEPIVEIVKKVEPTIEKQEQFVEEKDLEKYRSNQIVVELEPEQTLIEPGQVSGIGKLSVEKLNSYGITTWEQFYKEDSNILSNILKKSANFIESIKSEIAEDS